MSYFYISGGDGDAYIQEIKDIQAFLDGLARDESDPGFQKAVRNGDVSVFWDRIKNSDLGARPCRLIIKGEIILPDQIKESQ